MTDTVTRDDTRDPPAQTQAAVVRPPASAAQRQRAYRMRCKRAVIGAIGEEAAASHVTLLALLASDLAALDDQGRRSMHSALRGSARRILRILVTRYDIDLADDA